MIIGVLASWKCIINLINLECLTTNVKSFNPFDSLPSDFLVKHYFEVWLSNSSFSVMEMPSIHNKG